MVKEVRKALLQDLLVCSLTEASDIKATVREKLEAKTRKIYGLPPPEAEQTIDQILTVRLAIDNLLDKIADQHDSDSG